MRIAMFHNYYRQAGGEDVVFAEEASLLQAHDHDVLKYTVQNDDIREHSLSDRAALAIRTIWNRQSYRAVRRLIREWKPTVAHFHNTFPVISPAAYYAARAERVPVIQTLHNYRLVCPAAILYRDHQVCEACLQQVIPWAGIAGACYRQSRSATLAVSAMLASHRLGGTWRGKVDAYIALTEFARKKYIEGGLPAERVHVKPNFVHPDPGFSPGVGDYLLFVGRLVQEKGIQNLLKAWALVDKRIPLKIVGDGPLAPLVLEAAKTFPNIEYLGRRPLAEIYVLLGNARAMVFPSEWYEGFPKVIVEAFAKGTPVIGAALGAVTEVVGEGRTGLLFLPGSAESLAGQVEWAWANGVHMRVMGEEARLEYERYYTAERNYERLSEIYQIAIQTSRKSE